MDNRALVLHGTVDNLLDLRTDGAHRRNETIQLSLVLRLGRLHHQRARNRERQGGGVEAVINQALGHIGCCHARLVRQLAQVQDALVANQAIGAGVEHREAVIELTRNVVGVEHRVCRGAAQSLRTRHGDVGPGNRQHTRRAVERGCHRHATGVFWIRRVARQERNEVLRHADRANTRAATTVRDGEGLVQVQVRYVATEIARAGNASQRVHVRAVDVDLTAGRMHLVAHHAHVFLVHTVCGRVGQHDGGNVGAVLIQFLFQISQVDRAVFGSLDHNHAQVRQRRRRRISTVRRRRNQADVTLRVTVCHVVGADSQKARQLTGCTRVRLHADLGVAGDLHQPGTNLIDQLTPTRGVRIRRVRVDVGKTRPRDCLKTCGGVELHRAGTKRDHRAIQRQVLVTQRADVAHHLGLRVDAVKRHVREKLGCALKRLRQARRGIGGGGIHPKAT